MKTSIEYQEFFESICGECTAISQSYLLTQPPRKFSDESDEDYRLKLNAIIFELYSQQHLAHTRVFKVLKKFRSITQGKF